ncbi:MAG: hypothetical protein Pyrs2KO_06670 [Pyruvatibacter sp.]
MFVDQDTVPQYQERIRVRVLEELSNRVLIAVGPPEPEVSNLHVV